MTIHNWRSRKTRLLAPKIKICLILFGHKSQKAAIVNHKTRFGLEIWDSYRSRGHEAEICYKFLSMNSEIFLIDYISPSIMFLTFFSQIFWQLHICLFFSVKKTNKLLIGPKQVFFPSLPVEKEKSTNNCQIIDWKTSEI